LIESRLAGRDPADIARAFHLGLARCTAGALRALCDTHRLDTVVLSGGVFQNNLLLAMLKQELDQTRLRVWTNRDVPPNDGGISLGQAALAAGMDRATQPG
jgi:hydrogenase maturation protein HypF